MMRRINGSFGLSQITQRQSNNAKNRIQHATLRLVEETGEIGLTRFSGRGFAAERLRGLDCEYILIFRKGQPRKFKSLDSYRYISRYNRAERGI